MSPAKRMGSRPPRIVPNWTETLYEKGDPGPIKMERFEDTDLFRIGIAVGSGVAVLLIVLALGFVFRAGPMPSPYDLR